MDTQDMKPATASDKICNCDVGDCCCVSASEGACSCNTAACSCCAAASKKICNNCDVGDLCFKCIFSKVFSLEPFFDTPSRPYTFEAICIYQPNDFTGVAGADFSAKCTFKNSGKISWPTNVQLKLVNGTIVVYNALGLENEQVKPQEELNVTIDLKLPTTPGRYILNFRLVHGDNIEFGEKVSVNLTALAPPEIEVCRNTHQIDHKLLSRLE